MRRGTTMPVVRSCCISVRYALQITSPLRLTSLRDTTCGSLIADTVRRVKTRTLLNWSAFGGGVALTRLILLLCGSIFSGEVLVVLVTFLPTAPHIYTRG